MLEINNFKFGETLQICPECSHTRKKKRDKCLSVKRDNHGIVWNCFHCGYKGSRNEKHEYSMIQQLPKTKKWRDTLKVIEMPTKKTKVPNKFEEFWKSRKINNFTLDTFCIDYEKWTFSNGQQEAIVFPYIYEGKVVNKKFRSLNKQFRQLPDAPRTLYNIDSLNKYPDLPLVIVEGEMDVLSMHQCGYFKCISLPDGASKEARFREDDKRFEALKNHAELLSKETEIIIATDNDEAGNALALELAHRFGKDRCSRVHWGEISGDITLKDANDALVYGASDTIQTFIDEAIPYPVDGLYKASDYLNQVMALYEGKEEKPLTTGYTVLDTVYKLMAGTFTVVTGIPNHGKSNFLDQILMNASKLHKWKFAIFSPEHSTPRHLSRLSEKYLELPFSEGMERRMKAPELKEAMEYLNDHFFFLESREERPTIDWILDRARVSLLKNGINGLVIDPYNEIDTDKRGKKREDEYIKDIISACKRFARTHNICVWIVAHPAKMHRSGDGSYPVPSMYDISGSAHWHNMADVGLCVHRDFDNHKTVVYTKKIREQGVYGEIGEAMFTYDVSTRVYKESLIDKVNLMSKKTQSNWYDKD